MLRISNEKHVVPVLLVIRICRFVCLSENRNQASYVAISYVVLAALCLVLVITQHLEQHLG